ncbi:hypothetical protein D3C78_18330 [compost metagenome]
MKRGKGDVEAVHVQVIFLSVVLLVLISLSLANKGSVLPLDSYLQTQSNDILPTAQDMNPGKITSLSKADSSLTANMKIFFDDYDGSLSRLGDRLAGMIANFMFFAATGIGKATAFVVNLAFNSGFIASLMKAIIGGTGLATSVYTKIALGAISIGYGAWAIKKALLQRRYQTALIGIFTAILVYATGQYMINQGPEVSHALSTASSTLAQEVMVFSPIGGATDTTGQDLTGPKVVNDNIWLTSVYIPWSILQWQTPGISDQYFQNRYTDGELMLTIPTRNDLESTKISGTNWADFILKPSSLTSKEEELIMEALYSDDADKANPGGASAHLPNPSTVFTTSAILLIVNLVSFLIAGVVGICMLLIDVLLALMVMLAFFVFIIGVFPNIGARIYKWYVSLLIFLFIVKSGISLVLGTHIGLTTNAYLAIAKASKGSAWTISLGGLVSILVSAALIGLVILLVWLARKTETGRQIADNAASITANAALGRFDKVKEQMGRIKESGTLGIQEAIAENSLISGNMARNVFGVDAEKLIQQKLNTAESIAGSDKEGAMDLLHDAERLAHKFDPRSADVQSSSKFVNLTRRAASMRDSIRSNKLDDLSRAYKNGDIGLEQYEAKITELRGEAESDLRDTADININRSLEAFTDEASKSLRTAQLDNIIKRSNSEGNDALIGDALIAELTAFDQATREDAMNMKDERQSRAMDKLLKDSGDLRFGVLKETLRGKSGGDTKLNYLREVMNDPTTKQNPSFQQQVRNLYDKEKNGYLKQALENSGMSSAQQYAFLERELGQELAKAEGTRDEDFMSSIRKHLEPLAAKEIGLDERAPAVEYLQFDPSAVDSMKTSYAHFANNIAATNGAKDTAATAARRLDAISTIESIATLEIDEQITRLEAMRNDEPAIENKDVIENRLSTLKGKSFKLNLLDATNKLNTLDSNLVDVDGVAAIISGLQKDLGDEVVDAVMNKMLTPVEGQSMEGLLKTINGNKLLQTIEPILEDSLKNISIEFQGYENNIVRTNEDIIRQVREEISPIKVESFVAESSRIISAVKEQMNLSPQNQAFATLFEDRAFTNTGGLGGGFGTITSTLENLRGGLLDSIAKTADETAKAIVKERLEFIDEVTRMLTPTIELSRQLADENARAQEAMREESLGKGKKKSGGDSDSKPFIF